MADPIILLREYNMNKKEIIEEDNQYIFGEFSFPKTAKTNYLAWGSGKDGKPKCYYTLECLHFFLKNIELPHILYVQQASAEHVPYIRRPDRKKLLAYLNGESNNISESVDENGSIVDHISEKNGGPEKYNKEDHVPVSLFREYNLNKQEIREINNEIVFGKQSWPKTTKTNFLICKPKKSTEPKDYYTLESILFFMKNDHLLHPLYVEQAIAKNIPHVRRPDRNKLLGYLNGTINNVESIDENISAQTVINDTLENQNEYDEVPVAKRPKLQ